MGKYFDEQIASEDAINKMMQEFNKQSENSVKYTNLLIKQVSSNLQQMQNYCIKNFSSNKLVIIQKAIEKLNMFCVCNNLNQQENFSHNSNNFYLTLSNTICNLCDVLLAINLSNNKEKDVISSQLIDVIKTLSLLI